MKGKRTLNNKAQSKFPVILYKMIEENSPIISWDWTGKKFQIKNKEKFEILLITYFKCSTFHSFARQLNNYGFKKEPESNFYIHKYF